ncbi:MAG: hypothetical protein N4R38_07785 [Lactobacillus crispatus]|nr:hypothetical protein [Lactobacillus crispatus]
MLNLPNEFKTKYEKLLGTKKAQELFAAMNEESKKAFRINALKLLRFHMSLLIQYRK